MRFVGVDLAWGQTARTGLCLIEGGRVTASDSVRTDAEILDWLSRLVEAPCVVSFDAPMVVRNPTGCRPCEKTLSRCFGTYQAGAHSSNRAMPSFRGGSRAEKLAGKLRLNMDPGFSPGDRVRRAIEVYPHPALVALFGMPITLKYKAKKGRSLESRHEAFRQLIGHLEGLRRADPPVEMACAPRWAHLCEVSTTSGSGAALDKAEDELDAFVCAYIGLHRWTHGDLHSRVVGDVETGYIVTPVSPAQAACLDLLAPVPVR